MDQGAASNFTLHPGTNCSLICVLAFGRVARLR